MIFCIIKSIFNRTIAIITMEIMATRIKDRLIVYLAPSWSAFAFFSETRRETARGRPEPVKATAIKKTGYTSWIRPRPCGPIILLRTTLYTKPNMRMVRLAKVITAVP